MDGAAADDPPAPGAGSAEPVPFRIDPASLFSHLDLAGRRRVVVAVSGGGDSLALLLLFRHFVKSAGLRVEPLAVTVDHRLREESAAEAGQVAGIAARLGIAHRSLAWEGAKPAAGLSAAAREARHALLAQAAREAGTDLVLTGHTLDDQAETLAMRRIRGRGRGEAGMAPATLYDWNCWFARPLLGTRRAALRDVLSDLGQAWIEDPGNRNMAQERARTRAGLGEAETVLLAAEAMDAGRRRRDLGVRAGAIISTHARMPLPGLIRLDRAICASADREAAVYALRILLACAGGCEHLPEAARADALLGRMAQGNFRATLSRSVIDVRRPGVFLLRERRSLPAAGVSTSGLWDGRYRLEGPSRGWIAAGPDGAAAGEAADVPASLAKAAAAVRPALAAAEPVVAPWARYLPSFDLAAAAAAAALMGAASVPEPPFRRHNGQTA